MQTMKIKLYNPRKTEVELDPLCIIDIDIGCPDIGCPDIGCPGDDSSCGDSACESSCGGCPEENSSNSIGPY